LVLGISMSGVAEAMNLGVRLGIDPKKLAGIINTYAVLVLRCCLVVDVRAH
jgi:3-hydroxyisobutyrate dehydrogenase-like beta-hydroxyacid dehydrogenase